MLPVADGPQTCLLDLPAAAFSLMFSYVIAVDKPGRLVHFLLASTGCQQQVVQADSLWVKQCRLIGWLPSTSSVVHSATRAASPPPPPAAAAATPPDAAPAERSTTAAADRGIRYTDNPSSSSSSRGDADPAGSPAAAAAAVGHLTVTQPDSCPEECFAYYSARMLCRWRLRRVLRRYSAFLSPTSQRGLNPGAALEQLAAAEVRLGVALPWELWELYRWRDGQHGGVFADTARLLKLSEVNLEWIAADVATAINLAPASLSLIPTTTSSSSCSLRTTQQQGRVPPTMPGPAPSLLSGSSTSPVPSSTVVAAHRGAGRLEQQDSIFQGSQVDPQQQQHVESSKLVTAAATPPTAAAKAPVAGMPPGAMGTTLTPPGPGCVAALVFAAEPHGTKRYAVLLDGRVFLLKGFTQRQVSPSLTAFLHMLLS